MKQFKIDNELVIKIKKLIEDNNRDKLLSILVDIHYADLAEIFELLVLYIEIFLTLGLSFFIIKFIIFLLKFGPSCQDIL